MNAFRSDEGAQLIREASTKAHEQWPVDNEQHYVPTPEGDTFVVVAGRADAPPLVLIHGSGSNSAQWIDLMPFLAKHFRVYAVDVIGEPGLSAPSRPPLGGNAHAVWLDAVLDHFEIDDARFVGMSFGAWIILDYAIRRPARVNRMSLYCPMGIGKQKKGFLVVAIVLAPFGKWGQRKTLSAMLGSELSRMPEGRYNELHDQLRLVNKHFRYRLEFPIFTDADLRTLTMPVQVSVGDKDAAVDSAETVRRLASATPHADLQVLSDVGHLIPTPPHRELDFHTHEETT
ncbi:alpha/beta fold hydrolase [Rhodococcus sp. NPDC058521]|uniref:alpha/beta fold hydrolase n=1 Tax=Rhodococcus sp. NPDC058521 TaxID=3346536 RepID=UPI00364E67AB